MEQTLDRGAFWEVLKDRVVVIADLPAGPARELATRVNQSDGRGDSSLRTRAESSALFDLLHDELDTVHAPGLLTLVDGAQPSAVAKAIDAYRAASIDRRGFFDETMYMVHVTGWPADELRLGQPVAASGQARLALWATDPADGLHIPAPGRRASSSPRGSR